MPVDSEKEDQQANHTSSDESESDTDFFIPFVSSDQQRCPFYTVKSTFDGRSQRTTQIVFEYHLGKQIPRLRKPRELYGVSSTGSLPQPRWPFECEVIKEKVWHIEWNPPVPESLYRSTGLEQEAVHSEGRVVYLVNEGNKESCFTYSRLGGNHSTPKQVACELLDEMDNTLIFESRFESGNLQKVVQVGEYDYQLTLRTDLYTDKHTQWYYFRVQNTRIGIPYRFTIVNFTKPASLYNLGMRPLIYSEQEARISEIGWHRIGTEIKYYRNNLSSEGKNYYSLSWTFEFPHHRDTCYFAHCYPYTYSNLQEYLVDIANDHERSSFCKVRILCRSLAGNLVYVLTITNPSPSAEVMRQKKAVILTARVHPGETNSSWMMKGFLDYILSNRRDAQLLRDTFIFKVVPMLNPDGVIVGNYRCSLTGRDLNRNYRSILKDSFPIVYCTRNMIKRAMEEWDVVLYCDLHGHSRKQNVFMYGCYGRDGGGSQGQSNYLQGRIFPLMMSKNNPDKFSFTGCKFKVQKGKEGTGRVVMWKMGIDNSYTIESSFCGSSIGNRQGTHFSTKDLECLGYDFCDTLLDYCDPDRTKYYYCLKQLEEMMKEQRLNYDSETSLMDVASDLESSTSGSDSSDSNGLPAHLMALACKHKPRKKHLKTKEQRNSNRARRHRKGVKLVRAPQIHIFQKQKYVKLQRTEKPKKAVPTLERESFFQNCAPKMASIICLFFGTKKDNTSKCQSCPQESLTDINQTVKERPTLSSSSLTFGKPCSVMTMPEFPLRKDPLSSLLRDRVSQKMLSTRRANFSASAHITSFCAWEKNQDIVPKRGRLPARPQEEGPTHSPKREHPLCNFVPLTSISNSSISQELNQDGYSNMSSSCQRQKKVAFSLPAVPCLKRTRQDQEQLLKVVSHQGEDQTILPNMTMEVIKPTMSIKSVILPPEDMRDKSVQQTRPLSLPSERQKRPLRSFLHLGGSGEGTLNQNLEDYIKDFKYKSQRNRMWQSILPGLESEEQMARETTPTAAACNTPQRRIHSEH